MTLFSTARKCALRPKLVAYLGLSALAAIGGVPARGASIASYLKHHASPPHIQATEVKALQTFLAGGPTHWAAALPPKFPNGLVIADSTGNLLNKPVVNYLIWKRDLNTAYFDARHPRVAPLFQQYDNQNAQILAAIYAQYPPKAHAATSTASRSCLTTGSRCGSRSERAGPGRRVEPPRCRRQCSSQVIAEQGFPDDDRQRHPAVLHHDRDRLPQQPSPYRHRLREDRGRRPGAVP